MSSDEQDMGDPEVADKSASEREASNEDLVVGDLVMEEEAAASEVSAAGESSGRLGWEAISIFLLLVILLLGAYFRFTGLNWDDSYHLHPDERFLTDTASLLRVPADPTDYLSTSKSPLNPYNVGKGFYVYGNFPMSVVRYAGELATRTCVNLGTLCQHQFNSYNGIQLVGRFLSGLIDLISIAFVFLIGRRLYDWRVGVLAALFQSAAVMPIQQSHFFTMDNWAASLTTVAIYAAVRAAGLGDVEPRWRLRWWVMFGLTLGLAVASRINVAPLAGVIIISAIVWLARRGLTLWNWRTIAGRYLTLAPLFSRHTVTWRETQETADVENTARINGWNQLAAIDLQRVIFGLSVAAAVSLITFRLAQPYAFADREIARLDALAQTGNEPDAVSLTLRSLIGFNPQWLANMEEIQRLQQPEASFPPALQWTDRTPLVFPLTNMLLYGMGITAGIAAFLGLIWALWRIIRAHPEWASHAIPVFWSGAYFLYMGTRWVKSVRYFLPIYPTLFLLAAWAVFTIWRRMSGQRTAVVRRSMLVVLLALAALPSLLWANAFVQIYRQPVTRVAASHWMFENVPSGVSVLYEADGESHTLQLPLKQFDFSPDTPPLLLNVTMPESGVVTAVRFNYLTSRDGGVARGTLRVSLGQGDTAEKAFALDAGRKALTIDVPEVAVAADSLITLSAEVSPDSDPFHADTSHLMVESWDDALPVPVDGRNPFGSYYITVSNDQVPVTNPDSEEKRRQLVDWLDEADYIVLSSQRALWQLPRLPLAFPMMIHAYQGLFNGELGFDLAAQFHAKLEIGPLHISDTAGKISWGSPPEVGWPPPGDLAAEEAFSVYDHPPVWIFAKSQAYNHQEMVEALGEVDVSLATPMNPSEATQAPNGLLLSESASEVQRANGTFSQIFDLDGFLSRHQVIAAVVWWLSAVLLGWLVFPLAYVVFRGLPDRGYGLARILSLLFVSYFVWIAASLGFLPNTRATLALGMVVMGLVSLAIFVRQRSGLADYVRKNLSYMAVVELVGVLLFLIMLGIRLGNPDVWDVIWGGEKPMDMAYFTAVLKSTSFPPYDPWFAGGYINYYYYGFVYVGTLTKLLGLTPALAYNLILPTLFSFTGLGVFSVAYNLVAFKGKAVGKAIGATMSAINARATHTALKRKAVAAGLAAVVLAVLLGNLGEVGVLFDAWHRAGSEILSTGVVWLDSLAQTADGALKVISGQPAPISTGDWFWSATRVININPGEVIPITEFPFFTFLYGDLHAHMISLPLMTLALGWAVGLALQTRSGRRGRRERGRRERGGREGEAVAWWERVLQWVTGAIAIGALRATNTWDWPTYLVLGGLAVTYHVYTQNGRLNLQTLAQAGVQTAGLVLLSVIAFWPYVENYGVGYSSLKLWPGSYTFLGNYLSIYGLFLFLILTHLAREFRAWTRSWTEEGMRRLEPATVLLILGPLLYVVLLVALVLRGYWIAPVVLTLIIISGLLGLRPNLDRSRRIVLILISASLGLTLFVEIFVLDGDIGRMNTVFKFYMQVWLLLSVVGGVAVVRAWPGIKRRHLSRKVWQGVLAVLLFATALYPVLATRAKWDIRMSKEAPNTLDGMAFMEYVEYGDSGQTVPLRYDYDAIRWMQRNVEGSPVIAEAHSSNPYRSVGNRVSIYTGLPAIVGWDWHQRQQRAVVPSNLVSSRIQDVNRLYNTPVVEEAMSLIEKYDVEYIYSGILESVYYTPAGIAKFDRMVDAGYLESIYQNEGTTIYRVLN